MSNCECRYWRRICHEASISLIPATCYSGFVNKKRATTRRRSPTQTRSRATVDHILEGAARVFRREGWNATTNRVAREAGVSIGSLYEYFPNKQALLMALAERHVALAEQLLDAALSQRRTARSLLSTIQAAILTSQRFPSHALTLVSDVPTVGVNLAERARKLEHRVLAALTQVALAARVTDPELRAQAAFQVLGPLTARMMFESPERQKALSPHFLEMAARHLVP
jgi:AcrR family transcriptional regulator